MHSLKIAFSNIPFSDLTLIKIKIKRLTNEQSMFFPQLRCPNITTTHQNQSFNHVTQNFKVESQIIFYNNKYRGYANKEKSAELSQNKQRHDNDYCTAILLSIIE